MDVLTDCHPFLEQLRNDQDIRISLLKEKLISWQLNDPAFAKTLGKWFANFEPVDYALALKLLMNLDYYSEQRFNETFERRLEALRRKRIYISGERRNALLVLPNNKIDSAYRHGWLISKIEGITGAAVLEVDALTPEIINDQYLVFINDTHGSGNQFCRDIWSKVAGMRVAPSNVVILAIAIAAEAHKRFAKEGFQVVSSDMAKCARDVLNIGEFKRIEELGKEVNPNHPIGYGDTALLVAYHFQCPNNTLPLIWKTGSYEFPWHPLFPYLQKTSAAPSPRLKSGNPSASLKTTRGCQLSPARLPQGAELLVGREAELEMIDNAWNDPATHILTIVAFGGVGKTSLIIEWMARKAASGWTGVERVFEWSFYSQGTRGQGDASSDQFIKAALIFFGDTEMAESSVSAWDKGARLAQLIAEKPTLLVLDGLEPLQYPPGPLGGKFKDPAMESLLRDLARKNLGLCIATSRESLTDLVSYHLTAPQKTLEFLDEEAGAQILYQAGVKRAGAAEIHWNDEELKLASREVAGHALTLRLLGNYLSLAENGDIRKRSQIKLEDADREYITNPADADKAYGHAFKVISAYEKWFAKEGKEGQRLVAVLRILGLFDRPADVGCIGALRKPPAIPDLTKVLVDQGIAKWRMTLSRLAVCGLVWQPDNQSLDTHPLIREYFAKQLRDGSPKAWRAGHKRLYEYLTSSTKDNATSTPTLDDLQPLYQAVAHGCQAGMHQKTCTDVYLNKISKGKYVVRQLGAYGVDLGALSFFFEQPWCRVYSTLAQETQAWLLHQAGYRLRALGRLTEALEPMRTGLDISLENEIWIAAAFSANNLSELELLMGDISNAIKSAEQSVRLSEHLDPFGRITMLTTLANAVGQAGHRDDALKHYRAAETLLAEILPGHFLKSQPGFHYCDLILTEAEQRCCLYWHRALQGEEWRSIRDITGIEVTTFCKAIDDVELKIANSLTLLDGGPTLLDSAYKHLFHGRVSMCRAALTDSESERAEALQTAHLEIEDAVAGLRRAGTMQHVPSSLLYRAWFRFVSGDPGGAKADLDAAWEIAERGAMRPCMADIHLKRAMFFRDKAELQKARALISKCGYLRRNEELKDVEDMLGTSQIAWKPISD